MRQERGGEPRAEAGGGRGTGPDGGRDAGALAGRAALLLRSPDRAAATVAELRARGASTVLCPLIDFELPADTGALDAALTRFLDGGYDWMVLTSITTVRALKQRAAALGLTLAVPPGTRVCAVGSATARAAAAEGIGIDFQPHEQSAEGILAEWNQLALVDGAGTGRRASRGHVAGVAGAGAARGQDPLAEHEADAADAAWSPRRSVRAFLPQADLAAGTLEQGLTTAGWAAEAVIAYHTVEAPAAPGRRLTASLAIAGATETTGTGSASSAGPAGPGVVEIDAEALAAAHGAPAGVGAVFFTSPSIVRRYLEVAGGFPAGLAAVAIGHSTAAELRSHGVEPAGTAAEPTPAGLADAWAVAIAGP
ncbi:uroporphyrinogen-III synthase [Zafaria sp. Z1313]|uniref:uroporphyrinogen-III synthase n=1 Tax=unclassified Zafaria TaxID=2828765 RepID=UPI002E78A217|nr:uroporphyrinogen-III synthase [Zafaria sp. J156]MEE1620364.1 uroporphyrinogen-III synthase [Zafaria sp. J156]